MARAPETPVPAAPEVAAFIGKLLDRAAAVRLPELFNGPHPEALWRVADRHGVSVIGLRTPDLREAQLIGIMRYRLAQYLWANQLDPEVIYRAGLEHEPLSGVTERDVHVIAGCARSGEILAYGTLKALKGDVGNARLRDDDRPLFPVEEVFGRGLFNGVKILPDLPASRIREAGRLSKNHRCEAADDLVKRAPVEVLLGTFSLVRGPFLAEVEACVGDLELGVAKKNQDFFHLPTVIIRGVVPYAPDGSFGFFNYQTRTRYPYAFLSADIQRDRLDAIEAALERPGKEGLLALLAMKGEPFAIRSSLEPEGGLSALNAADVPQSGVAMAERRQMLDLGDRVRAVTPFRSLSVPEATVLGTFLERRAVEPGETIIRQGDVGDDLYIIETGRAEVHVVAWNGGRTVVATLDPGECFGEIALVTGGERTADVVSTTPMTLLRLTRDAYARYLSHMVEVERELARTAIARAHQTLRAARTGAT